MKFTCRHCLSSIGSDTGPYILGQNLEQRVAECLEALSAHLAQHPTRRAASMALIGQAGAVSVLCHFETANLEVRQLYRASAAAIRRAVTRQVTDADIEKLVIERAPQLDRPAQTTAIRLLCDLRDYLNYDDDRPTPPATAQGKRAA